MKIVFKTQNIKRIFIIFSGDVEKDVLLFINRKIKHFKISQQTLNQIGFHIIKNNFYNFFLRIFQKRHIFAILNYLFFFQLRLDDSFKSYWVVYFILLMKNHYRIFGVCKNGIVWSYSGGCLEKFMITCLMVAIICRGKGNCV